MCYVMVAMGRLLCESVPCGLSRRIYDAVIGNLAKNFAEGTEYFKVIT